MRSTPSRLSDASHDWTMCLRDRPPRFGPGPMRILTLVAMTASSRDANSRTAFPVISSLTPSEYTSAVSKKLIPSSTARRKNGMASSSSRIQGRHSRLPKLMQPSAMRETTMPLSPRRAYCKGVTPGLGEGM